MSEPDLDYAAIQRRVEKNLLRQKWLYRILFFVMHVLFYVVSMGVIWGTVMSNPQLRDVLADPDSGASILVLLPTVLWAAVILFHAASLYFESSLGEKALRKRLLMREVGDELLRQEPLAADRAEKPKRRDTLTEARYRLSSDDGEFVLLDEDQPPDESDYPARTRQAGSS
ncbi:MAG: hypothetical protein K8J31_23850 [Anaerolineae bacterium]|nr:hypothetical protein [Anaerolineae bacterium]